MGGAGRPGPPEVRPLAAHRAGQPDGQGRQPRGHGHHGGPADDEPVKRPKVEAQAVAAEVEARIAADRKRKGDKTPRIAHQSWDPVSVGLLLPALAFFVIGVFVL